MKSGLMKHLLILALLLMLQIWVFPLVHFWSITPFIYLYALIIWPAQWSVYANLFLAFVAGLILDFSLDTPGMHSMSFTLVSYFRLPLLRWLSSKEDIAEPGEKSMGFLSFWKYAILLILIHHSTFFLLESFAFFSLPTLLFRILLGSVATLILCFFLERFRR
jgi:rod shape-determining protein MreD